MTLRGQTPSQTVGPFFHFGLLDAQGTVDRVDPEGVAGGQILVHGTVRDGAGEPVGDAMVEVWQADGAGRYRHPADGRAPDIPDEFIGFGRVGTSVDGSFRVLTVMPGTVPASEGRIQAPHLNLQLFARGLLNLVAIRIYFAGRPENEDDPVLSSVPANRRETLLAHPDGEDGGVVRYRFDIVLQGERETVFFDA